jgi:hypothetical protein
MCSREIPRPAGESAGLRNDAVMGGLERLFGIARAQRDLLFRSFPGFWRFLKRSVDDVARVVDPLPFQEFRDAEDLQARESVDSARRLVEAGFGGFLFHRLGRQVHADQNSDFCLLAFDHAAQVADVGGVECPGFDGQNDLFGLAAFFVVEVEASRLMECLQRRLTVDESLPNRCPFEPVARLHRTNGLWLGTLVAGVLALIPASRSPSKTRESRRALLSGATSQPRLLCCERC